MSEITAQWVHVGARTFHRLEMSSGSSPQWSTARGSASTLFAASPWGGPVLSLDQLEQAVQVFRSTGAEGACWRWKGGRAVAADWSTEEEAVVVAEDGNVVLHDLHGNYQTHFSMGREAKDLRVASARVFRSRWGTGVAVLTNAKRFFVVNNVRDPRVRKLPDVDLPPGEEASSVVWAVMADERHAKVVVSATSPAPAGQEASSVMSRSSVVVLSSQAQAAEQLPVDGAVSESDKVLSITPSQDGASLAIVYSSGLLWLGGIDGKKGSFQFTGSVPSAVAWCAPDAVVAVFPEASRAQVVTAAGEAEDLFITEFYAIVQELDGARLFCSGGQELVQEVPQCLIDTFSIGSVAPGALLRFAAEEFSQKSHRADEYLREIPEEKLDAAVSACVQCAGHVLDTGVQKELLRAAQFGKYFLSSSSSSTVSAALAVSGSTEIFTNMCLTLRILNAFRGPQVGIPMTIKQYNFLTPKVVLDRLLARRLYPLAVKLCQLLKMSAEEGENRVLAHWACYKVAQDKTEKGQDDASVARAISAKLGHNPNLSYSDIAARAAECGRKELAVKLLEHETRVSRQVPLLVQLGDQKSTALALSRALASGDRDLAFSVLLHLKAVMSSSEFHLMMGKNPMSKVLFRAYSRQMGPSALEEWFEQEDDFAELAGMRFEQAHETHRYETRRNRLTSAQEQWRKAKKEPLQALVEENLKLLSQQSGLENKLEGQSFVGKTANETISQLLETDQLKLAEKVRQEMKVSDRRFAWLRVRAMVKRKQWDDLKKFARQKRPPLPANHVVRVVHEQAGEERAREFLTEEFVSSTAERVDLLTEFGMFLEAANAAFSAKSVDLLNGVEAVCAGRDDILKTIANFKTRLLTK